MFINIALRNICKVCFMACFLSIFVACLMNEYTYAAEPVGLYDVVEIQVENLKSYNNPFDYREIELKANFTSPSGKQFGFFGFYDGDGQGGQIGNIWEVRFMPNEIGTWNYTYFWTDGAEGDSGSFEVVNTGLNGPLQVDTDNPRYFMDAFGNPFDWRGYDLHVVARYTNSKSFLVSKGELEEIIKKEVLNKGYNFTMWDGMINRSRLNTRSNTWDESWWLNTNDINQFDIQIWDAFEDTLRIAKNNEVYVITFAGMIHQGDTYSLKDFKVFLRYWIARFGAFYNMLGWSPTWEWGDIWSADEVNQIMQFIEDNNPFPTLLTIHDHSHIDFTSWLDFSMRQQQSRDIFEGNCRACGQHGGVADPFVDMPIIGSEDIWETESGLYGQPRNATEVRRGAWGIMMAGVLPLYSEWHFAPPPSGGNGTAEPEVRRMFDFFYSKTRYREYEQLNNLVSASGRQIASGIPGIEYLVYDENGGEINIDLSGTSSANSYSVLWFDPVTASEQNGDQIQGGSSRALISPFSGDTVLLLRKKSSDPPAPPLPPKNLKITGSEN